MDNNPSKFRSYVRITLFIISAGIFVLGGIATSRENDLTYTFWLWFLFSIPLIIHFFGWFYLHENRREVESKKSQNIVVELNPSGESVITEGELITPSNIESEQEKKEEQKAEAINRFCTFYNRTMLLSVALYCIGWSGYNLKSHLWESCLWWLSLFCLISIFVQFGILLYVTYIIMELSHKRTPKDNTYTLKRGLEFCPFWRFAHFFAIFMSISFLFGFAFAFHDLEYRKIHKNALFVENLASDEEIEKELEKKNEEERRQKTNQTSTPTPMPSNEVSNPTPTPTPDELNPAEPFCFYFESARANLIPKEKKADHFNSTKDDSKLEFMRFKENYESLEGLVNQININKSKGIIRLTLIGSADDNPIPLDGKKTDKSKNNIKVNVYPSNYDLSEARIQTAKNEITKELYKRNNKEWQRIDWITVAHSNEEYTNQSKDSDTTQGCTDIIYDKDGKRIQNKIDGTNSEDLTSGKRSVAVYLNVVSREPSAELQKVPNLMDYMYFSIYTITTTGYGDIKPTTRYAKFLVSLENFFEVFFLVCFMNSLIALRSEPKISPGP